MSKLKITINKHRCVGSTYCTMESPHIFGLDASGQSKVLDEDSTDNEAIMKAAHACPMAAIIVEDMETFEKIWPKD